MLCVTVRFRRALWFGGLSDNIVAGIQFAESLQFAVGRKEILMELFYYKDF